MMWFDEKSVSNRYTYMPTKNAFIWDWYLNVDECVIYLGQRLRVVCRSDIKINDELFFLLHFVTFAIKQDGLILSR